jgi:hypothetical protein
MMIFDPMGVLYRYLDGSNELDLFPDEARELFFKLGFMGGIGNSSDRGLKEQDVWKWMGRRIDWGGLQAYCSYINTIEPISQTF